MSPPPLLLTCVSLFGRCSSDSSDYHRSTEYSWISVYIRQLFRDNRERNLCYERFGHTVEFFFVKFDVFVSRRKSFIERKGHRDVYIYIYIHFLSRLLWSVIKINRFKWFDRRTTVDSFEILKSYVVERPVYSRSLMKNFVCQNFGDNKFIVVSRWLYQWPRIIILMKPPFAICTEPLFDSDCVLFFKLNEHAGRCLTYTHKHPHTHINTQREREWER